MSFAEMCEKIRNREKFPHVFIENFVQQVANNKIPVEQVEEWLRAVYEFGLHDDAKIALTKSMMESGEIITWEDAGINRDFVVDKHSTGGVGDKMSIMLAPALAACGLYVPMLAGRGLGHTGGTIDKLEAIPGFSTDINPKRMKEIVLDVGCCIAAQSSIIAPADAILYAVRDVTGTVASIPLITASIISKKAAEGISSLVLDVKTGIAAFMQSEGAAIELAKSMVDAANGLGVNTIAQVTTMNSPIGNKVGNSLEILESVKVLNGEGPLDTIELVSLQGGALLHMTGKSTTIEEGKMMIREVLSDGSALECFRKMCVSQGVEDDIANKLCTEPEKILPCSSKKTVLYSSKSGFISKLNAMTFAKIACELGAGRQKLGDVINHGVGLEFNHCLGDEINEGDAWLIVHHDNNLNSEKIEILEGAMECSNDPIEASSRLICVI